MSFFLLKLLRTLMNVCLPPPGRVLAAGETAHYRLKWRKIQSMEAGEKGRVLERETDHHGDTGIRSGGQFSSAVGGIRSSEAGAQRHRLVPVLGRAAVVAEGREEAVRVPPDLILDGRISCFRSGKHGSREVGSGHLRDGKAFRGTKTDFLDLPLEETDEGTVDMAGRGAVILAKGPRVDGPVPGRQRSNNHTKLLLPDRSGEIGTGGLG